MVLPLFLLIKAPVKALDCSPGVTTAMLLIVISVIGSPSITRCALAIYATGFFLWLKRLAKFFRAGNASLAIGIYSFMPERWHDRMGTITNYQKTHPPWAAG